MNQKNNKDILYQFEEKSPEIQKFKNKIYNDTIKYQKKFGFELSSDTNHSTWNNEADAFKHAYMQAVSYLKYGEITSKLGWLHERNGNKYYGQPKGEENMDNWNNEIGRQIGKELKKELQGKARFFTIEQIEDIAAVKVMERMRKGDLITSPDDKRSYEKDLKGKITGFATQVQKQKPFTPEEIGKMTPAEFTANEPAIMQQLKEGLIKPSIPDYSNFKNPHTADSKLYTREDIARMSAKEYEINEKAIMAQLNAIGIPSQNDLNNNTNSSSQNNSKKSAGSNKSYSGNKHWVTINGNHVLMDK